MGNCFYSTKCQRCKTNNATYKLTKFRKISPCHCEITDHMPGIPPFYFIRSDFCTCGYNKKHKETKEKIKKKYKKIESFMNTPDTNRYCGECYFYFNACHDCVLETRTEGYFN